MKEDNRDSRADTSRKEAHRIGTMHLHGVPDEAWTADYDWTRTGGSQVYPVPDGWVVGIFALDGVDWHYYGEDGIGKSRDSDLNSDPYPTDPEATLISKSVGSTGSTENVEWELSVDDQTVFRCVNPNQEDLYRATAEALHAYHEGLLADQISDIAPESG